MGLTETTTITAPVTGDTPQADDDFKFWLTFEQAAVGIALVAPDGRFLRVNPELCAFLAYSEAELKRSGFQYLTHHEDLATDIAYVTQMLNGEISTYRMEKRYIRKDGRVVWAALSVSLVRDDMGEPLHFISVVQDIDRLKRAEEEIRQAKEFSERLINSSLDGIFAFDRECRYTVWNPGMEGISGYAKEEVLGRLAAEVFPHMAEAGEEHVFAEVLAGKGVISKVRPYDTRPVSAEGFYEGHYSPLRSEAGEVLGGLVVIHDITERKVAQEELVKSVDRYEAVCENASDFISVHDLKGNYVFANRACETLLGYRREEMQGSNANTYLHPDDVPIITKTYKTFLAGSDKPANLSYRLLRKDGEYIWLETSARPVAGTYGLAREILCVTRASQYGQNTAQEASTHEKTDAPQEDAEAELSLDPMTGVSNRQTLDDFLTEKLGSRRASTYPLGCLLVDIDGMEGINSTHGQPTGDKVIKRVAEVLAKSCRVEDFIGRYGADEFLIVLSNTDAGGTIVVGEKVVHNIRAIDLSDLGMPEGATVSIGGVCVTYSARMTPQELTETLDSQLYHAQEAGGNCIIMNARDRVKQFALDYML